MLSCDVAVIGAGLFGSIIACALRSLGRSVVVLDGRLPESGSRPAACLMKPGWFSSLGKDVYEPALSILDRLYRLREVEFRVGKAVGVRVFWIPPQAILAGDVIQVLIKRVSPRGNGWVLWDREGEYLETASVIVAAGIWTSLLAPEVEQKGLAATAFLWPQESIDHPVIQPWAPYKQIVAFNRGDGLWVGDGSAILRSNWGPGREASSLARCRGVVGVRSEPVRLFGVRPYHAAKPCLLKEVRPGFWVATGGAKNGTLAAGWCAQELVRRFQ